MSAPPTRGEDARTSRLAAGVEATSAALEALWALLEREREALSERADAPALEAIAREKQALVEQVTALYAGLREEIALAAGQPGSVAQALERLRSHRPSLSATIDRLVSLTRECQRANHDNGVLVSAGLQSSRSALDTLQRIAAEPGSPATYGPSGRAAREDAGARVTLRA